MRAPYPNAEERRKRLIEKKAKIEAQLKALELAPPSEERVALYIRVPRSLHKRVVAESEAMGVSITDWAIQALTICVTERDDPLDETTRASLLERQSL